MDLTRFIRDVPDFPKPGIVFKDITPLLKDRAAVDYVERTLAGAFRDAGVTTVAGIESRGFLFGMGVARELGVGFVPIRKAGKLPHETISHEYALEYGTAEQEIHLDAAGSGDRVLIVDDLLATGGTAEASARLIRKLGAQVAGFAFVIELAFLKGRERLEGHRVEALLVYD
jgi:adenine phosphoribosyltransferase